MSAPLIFALEGGGKKFFFLKKIKKIKKKNKKNKFKNKFWKL